MLAFLAELDRSGLAPRTGNGTYRMLASILRSAVYDELLVKSPCYRILLLPEVPRKLVLFTPDQATELLAAARPEHHAVLAVTLGTGMRQGEALGLRLPNVRLLQRELTVDEQSRVCAGGVEITRELATATSRRVIPLPPFAVQAVARHIEHYGVRAEDGLLFRNPRDLPWRRGSFNESVWKPTLRRAGLPLGYGFHALRHTDASSLIAAGVHARVVQARLGHKSIVETMDTYGTCSPTPTSRPARRSKRCTGRDACRPRPQARTRHQRHKRLPRPSGTPSQRHERMVPDARQRRAGLDEG